MRRRAFSGAVLLAAIVVTGCSSSEPGAQHPADAAEFALRAVAASDHEALCDLMGDESGPMPEGSRGQCMDWAEWIAPNLSDDLRADLEEVTVSAVTLTGEGRARLANGDYEGVSIPLTVDLVKSSDVWFIEDIVVGEGE